MVLRQDSDRLGIFPIVTRNCIVILRPFPKTYRILFPSTQPDPPMDLIQQVAKSVIGAHTSIKTPFGEKPLIYADYTASGRSLGFIEDFIRDQVLPYYANTHSESSLTGAQTNHYREQARQIIRQCVNGTEQDKVIFCGSGATSAINKIIDLLDIRRAEDASDRPVVFIGPYEHHSNELPWREIDVDLVVIPTTADGAIDLQALKLQLSHYQARSMKIGSFSAASNVTGLLTDVDAVALILRQGDALSFWDYAAAAPYLQIDMANIDAAFVSPHKFPGGPGTPGLLIAKENLFRNDVPVTVGGGTVQYVSIDEHVYSNDVESREEGGTPAIVEAIRAGMVFKLQNDVGTERIREIEVEHARHAIKRLAAIPNVELLGSEDLPRLPILSFRIRAGSRYLHYGFITALLNDLFGIQARGGCSCAGPYGHKLLDLDSDTSREISQLVQQGFSIFRPGWTRFSLNYFTSNAEIEYILDAVAVIAEKGFKLLPDYEVSEKTGIWHHRHHKRKLLDLDWSGNECDESPQHIDFPSLMHQALTQFEQPAKLGTEECSQGRSKECDVVRHKHRWFTLASDLN
jgi:selenocysteine lyase/cysteine desulfurase